MTQAEKVSFHVLNRKIGNRVRRVYVDAKSAKPLEEDDEVRGYEVGKDEFIFIEEEDIEAVQVESSHTLDLNGFADKSSIEQIYLDTPYYVTPADKVSQKAFAVIRDALAEKKMAGLARIVLYQRERPVVIEPHGKGMMLTTLRYGDTVRGADHVFADIEAGKPNGEMIGLHWRRLRPNRGGRFRGRGRLCRWPRSQTLFPQPSRLCLIRQSFRLSNNSRAQPVCALVRPCRSSARSRSFQNLSSLERPTWPAGRRSERQHETGSKSLYPLPPRNSCFLVSRNSRTIASTGEGSAAGWIFHRHRWRRTLASKITSLNSQTCVEDGYFSVGAHIL